MQDSSGVTDPTKAVYRLPQASYHVWTVADMRILNELQNPVAIAVYGAFENPHRPGGMQHTCRTVYQNKACLEYFGLPRTDDDLADEMDKLTDEVRLRRRTRLKSILLGKLATTRMDVHEMFGPIYQNVSANMPKRMARIDSKPIRVRSESGGHEQTAVLHVIETEASTAELRGSAMHHRSSKHSLLFSSKGKLLHANKAAVDAYQQGTGDMPYAKRPTDKEMTFRHLFELGPYQSYPGGAEEAQTAYSEAYNAIFDLQLDYHSHMQPYLSASDGTARYAQIELWPMIDPVSEVMAVMVKRHDVTKDVKISEQLRTQQEELQRHNQELEQEQFRLEQEAEGLAQRLDAVLQDKFAGSNFDADTPIDKTLTFLQSIVKGAAPPIQTALELYNVLSKSDTASLRQPVGLEQQLLKDNEMDTEVGQSMLQLLKGGDAKVRVPAASTPDAPTAQRPVWTVDSVPQMRDPAATHIATASQPASEELTAMLTLSVTPVVERFLQEAEHSWQFDIFGFADATPGNTLAILTFFLVKRAGFTAGYQLDEVKVCRTLQALEAGYRSENPYHNSIHVASVVQMTHMLLCHGGLLQSQAMDRLEHLSTLWSAAIHDYGHGGVNNDFLVNTHHELAMTYNDQSPLENYHLAASTRLLSQPGLMFFPVEFVSSNENIRRLRSTCINQVLGTDMKKHFDIISRFQAAFKAVQTGDAGQAGTKPSINWQDVKPQDKTLVHQMLLKCADIGHLAADPKTHKRWAYQLEEEFFRQGDQERACGLPVSPLMDRSQQGGMTRSQLGFFNIVGLPLFKAMAELFEDSQPMLDGVLGNLRVWEAAAEAPA